MSDYKIFSVFMALAFLFISCVDKKIEETFASVESIMWVKPDSALMIIESIDTLKLKGKTQKAKYSLLYSMALDRNQVVVTNPRIITPAVQYYECHGNLDDRLKSLCYLGRIQNAMGRYDEAIVTFSKALEHSDKVKDRRMVGFVCSDIALTYAKTYNYSECNACYDKAITCFEESGDEKFAQMMELNKAKTYVNMMNYAAADSLFSKIISDDKFPLNYKVSAMKSYGKMLTFGQYADEKKALEIFEKAIKLSGNKNTLSLNQNCAYAYLLEMFGRKEDSRTIMSYLRENGYGESAEFNYCMARICRLNKDNGRAFDYLVRSTQDYDARVLEMQVQSSSIAQKDYYLEQSHEKEKAMIFHRFWTICYVAVSIIIILSVGVFFYGRARRAEDERKRILILKEAADVRLDETDKSITQIKAEYDIIKKNYLKLYLSQGFWLDRLASILYSAKNKNLKPYGLRAEVYEKISDMIGRINVDDVGQRRFETELNRLYGGVMTQFRDEFRNLLDETDVRFFSCVVARFDASIILHIFNLPSKSAVYMRKNRLKEKIRNSEAPNKEKFLLF